MTMNEIKAWDKEKVSRQQLNELEESEHVTFVEI